MADETVVEETHAAEGAAAAGAEGATPSPAAEGTPSAASTPQPSAAPFDPKTLPAEAQAWLESQRKAAADEAQGRFKDYDQLSAQARSFQTLAQSPRFREWFNANGQQLFAQPQPQQPEMSDEEFAGLFADKAKFQAYLNSQVRAQAEAMVAPRQQQMETQLQTMQRVSELEKFAAANPDFWDLDKAGKIEPLIQQYPNLAIGDIYKLAKYETVAKDAVARAHGIVQTKRGAVSEKPGVSSGHAAGNVKVTNRREAMEIAMEYARAGKEIPDFDFASTR